MADKSFGAFLAEKRKDKGFTQKQFSEMLFVSVSTVSKWETDAARPDVSLISKISELLDVTEHELLSASIDTVNRKNMVQARKWRNLAYGWNLFFLLSYGITLLACFIVDIATGGGLSWFFIVLSALVLAATFTTFPQFITKFRLLFISLSELAALLILLGVCCIFTGGTWFLIAAVPVILAYVMCFLPIFISIYKFPERIKQFSALICFSVDYIILVIMLAVISVWTDGNWFFSTALPLSAYSAIFPLIGIIIGYIRCNKLLKSGVIVFAETLLSISIFYILPALIEKVVDKTAPSNPFAFNFSLWTEEFISANVAFLTLITAFLTAAILTVFGIIKEKRIRKFGY